VELVQVDPFEAKALEAGMARGSEVLGPPVGRPDRVGVAAADHAALRRDHEAVGVGVERLRDQQLAQLGPVGVGGVDQVDAELDGSP
jgi:hypothetical protein